jgi:hypothetical protein
MLAPERFLALNKTKHEGVSNLTNTTITHKR